MTRTRAIVLLPILSVVLSSSLASAHGGHDDASAAVTPTPTAAAPAANVQAIGAAYREKIEPIFKDKCMDCHSAHTVYPWYHQIPGVKQFIDSDIAEGREHLDFTDGYPFKSHATPQKDLDAIAEEVTEGDMPPLMYRLMHRGTGVTDSERQIILDWVKNSKELLAH